MTYNQSNLDRSNFKWFENDNTRGSLSSISLTTGTIRGLTQFSVKLKYPITVFSGSNGSGKSTMLALAACAFHNKKNGFTPSLRSKSYYTFQDFFVQSSSELPVEGVRIGFGINHNRWRGGKLGIAHQYRSKKKGGKWSDYNSRVNRNVVYFGVQRVVPHYERSTHKSYRSKFRPSQMAALTRKRISEVAARIIGKPYTDFDSYVHTKYSLPVATANGISYSGFNMVAGESSVFEILTALFAAGDGALLVIDEVELGLHELAQVRLVEELKKLCFEFKCQVICSSHSHGVLRTVPPEARFHIESIDGSTFITPGVSADFACGKMGKPDAYELDIFVEDLIGLEILRSALPIEMRKRVKLRSIGSHSAVIRQLASRRLEGVENCICVLDGDQSGNIADVKKLAHSACEAGTDKEKISTSDWIEERVFYLPGAEWPERWVVDQALELARDASMAEVDSLINRWGLSGRSAFIESLNEASSAEKHAEFFALAQAVELDEHKSRNDIIALVVMCRAKAFAQLVSGIGKRLP